MRFSNYFCNWWCIPAILLWLQIADAQTNTYHLHQEASSTSGLNQLRSTGPDILTPSPLLSAQLRNNSPGEYVVKQFDTQTGVPNTPGVIASGAVITFTLWMRKTANVGTLFPRAKLNLNSANGTSLCTAYRIYSAVDDLNGVYDFLHYYYSCYDDRHRPAVSVGGYKPDSRPG
jgi:hypothetical protein